MSPRRARASVRDDGASAAADVRLARVAGRVFDAGALREEVVFFDKN